MHPNVTLTGTGTATAGPELSGASTVVIALSSIVLNANGSSLRIFVSSWSTTVAGWVRLI